MNFLTRILFITPLLTLLVVQPQTVSAQTKPADYESKITDHLQLYQAVYNKFTDENTSRDELKTALNKYKQLFDGLDTKVWNDLDTTATEQELVDTKEYLKNINKTFTRGHKMRFNLKGARIGDIQKNYKRNSLTCEVKVMKQIMFDDFVTVTDSVTIDTVSSDTTRHTHVDTVNRTMEFPYNVYMKFDIEKDIMVGLQIYAIAKVGSKPEFLPLEGDDLWWVTLDKDWKTYYLEKLKMPEFPDRYDFGKLGSLTKLDLTEESFTNLKPLTRMTGVKKLYLQGTPVSDLTPLEGMRNLRVLDISKTQVKDLTSLSKMTRLQILKINDLGLESIDPIKTLENLVALEMSTNELENIDAVANFSKLEEIDFSFNQKIKSIKPLAGLENLTNVRFVKMQVEDLTPLSNCPNLVELDCFNNNITSLAPIQKCYKITKLNFGYNKIYTLDELKGMRYIVELRLKGAPVKDISVLNNFKNLQYLDLSETWVEDLSPAYNCEEILTLKAVNSKIPKGQIQRFKKRYPDCKITYY